MSEWKTDKSIITIIIVVIITVIIIISIIIVNIIVVVVVIYLTIRLFDLDFYRVIADEGEA